MILNIGTSVDKWLIICFRHMWLCVNYPVKCPAVQNSPQIKPTAAGFKTPRNDFIIDKNNFILSPTWSNETVGPLSRKQYMCGFLLLLLLLAGPIDRSLSAECFDSIATCEVPARVEGKYCGAGRKESSTLLSHCFLHFLHFFSSNFCE